jgi:HPt (histidine-containing phosphotransfer) domain-containing protein
MNDDDPIDAATFAELKDTAGADFVADLVATFVDEEAPPMLAELRAAWAEGAVERFRRAAHSLKSNAMTFGALPLGEMARALELGGLPAGDAPLAALEAAYARAAAALRERVRG